MEFEEFKKYVDSVKDNEKFIKLNKFTRMLDAKENLDIYQNLKSYLGVQHPKRDSKSFFEPNYEFFINFLEDYFINKKPEIILDDTGCIDLQQTLYITQPRLFFGGDGCFVDKQIMFSDGSKHISKIPLNFKGNSGINNKYCVFSPIIASNIAKMLEVDTAEFSLARIHNGQNRILSKNFLRENEELVVYTDEELTVSESLDNLENALRMRKYPENEIAETKFEFLKQEFIAKLIGLKDQKPENSPLVHSKDEQGYKHIKLAPMIDFDYSFHIAEKRDDMSIRCCENGKTDIDSLIKEFSEYPGFMEFVETSLEKLDMEKVYHNIYKETGIICFANYREDEEMVKFIQYVNGNIEKAKETVAELKKEERGER